MPQQPVKTLTGKRRHRVMKRCFSDAVLVLQVEVNVVPAGWQRYNGAVPYTYWRDATTEDLTVE